MATHQHWELYATCVWSPYFNYSIDKIESV